MLALLISTTTRRSSSSSCVAAFTTQNVFQQRRCASSKSSPSVSSPPPLSYKRKQHQPKPTRTNERRRFREEVSLSLGDDRKIFDGDHKNNNNNDGDDGEPKCKKNKNYDRNKNKKPNKNKVQLYRADRVLANRSGKTRTECFKLLTKHAVSIVVDNDDNEEAVLDKGETIIITTPTTTESDDTVAQQLPENLKFQRLKGPKDRIPMNARLFLNQKFEVPSLPPLLTVYHKPKWTLSTMGEDAKNRRNLQDLIIPFGNQMHPVGRLDYDSSGLLLFSSSGPLTQTLLHPKYEKEKEYVVTVANKVSMKELQEKLKVGVELVDVSRSAKLERHQQSIEGGGGNDGAAPVVPKRTITTRADIRDVQHVPTAEVKAYLDDIRATLPKEYNVTDLNLRGYMDVFDATELSQVRLVVREGKHRMVRRMMASCGHPVVSLKRERMGVIELKGLPEGSFRHLTDDEEAWAQSLLDKLS